MDKKMKTLLFPYSIEFAPIIRYKNLIPNIEFTKLVSPIGWGICEKDANIIYNEEKTGLIVTSQFDESLDDCEAVIFAEYDSNYDIKPLVQNNIFKAINKNKNLIFTQYVEENLKESIDKLCRSKGIICKYEYGNNNGSHSEYLNEAQGKYKINTPIVLVLGTCEQTNKFDIQLSLRKYISKIGYNISQVGSRKYCEILGFHSFPNFMSDKHFSETEKIILFNRYIKEIEITENPDILIIGVPGGILSYNEIFTNDFGVLAYEVANAITPDIVILSTVYDEFPSLYFEKLGNMFKHKFGFEVDYYNLANIKIDWGESKSDKKLHYTTLSSNFLDNVIASNRSNLTPLYNTLNSTDAENLSNNVIIKLSRYEEIGII